MADVAPAALLRFVLELPRDRHPAVGVIGAFDELHAEHPGNLSRFFEAQVVFLPGMDIGVVEESRDLVGFAKEADDVQSVRGATDMGQDPRLGHATILDV
jgi:hypothetical protein